MIQTRPGVAFFMRSNADTPQTPFVNTESRRPLECGHVFYQSNQNVRPVASFVNGKDEVRTLEWMYWPRIFTYLTSSNANKAYEYSQLEEYFRSAGFLISVDHDFRTHCRYKVPFKKGGYMYHVVYDYIFAKMRLVEMRIESVSVFNNPWTIVEEDAKTLKIDIIVHHEEEVRGDVTVFKDTFFVRLAKRQTKIEYHLFESGSEITVYDGDEIDPRAPHNLILFGKTGMDVQYGEKEEGRKGEKKHKNQREDIKVFVNGKTHTWAYPSGRANPAVKIKDRVPFLFDGAQLPLTGPGFERTIAYGEFKRQVDFSRKEVFPIYDLFPQCPAIVTIYRKEDGGRWGFYIEAFLRPLDDFLWDGRKMDGMLKNMKNHNSLSVRHFCYLYFISLPSSHFQRSIVAISENMDHEDFISGWLTRFWNKKDTNDPMVSLDDYFVFFKRFISTYPKALSDFLMHDNIENEKMVLMRYYGIDTAKSMKIPLTSVFVRSDIPIVEVERRIREIMQKAISPEEYYLECQQVFEFTKQTLHLYTGDQLAHLVARYDTFFDSHYGGIDFFNDEKVRKLMFFHDRRRIKFKYGLDKEPVIDNNTSLEMFMLIRNYEYEKSPPANKYDFFRALRLKYRMSIDKDENYINFNQKKKRKVRFGAPTKAVVEKFSFHKMWHEPEYSIDFMWNLYNNTEKFIESLRFAKLDVFDTNFICMVVVNGLDNPADYSPFRTAMLPNSYFLLVYEKCKSARVVYDREIAPLREAHKMFKKELVDINEKGQKATKNYQVAKAWAEKYNTVENQKALEDSYTEMQTFLGRLKLYEGVKGEFESIFSRDMIKHLDETLYRMHLNEYEFRAYIRVLEAARYSVEKYDAIVEEFLATVEYHLHGLKFNEEVFDFIFEHTKEMMRLAIFISRYRAVGDKAFEAYVYKKLSTLGYFNEKLLVNPLVFDPRQMFELFMEGRKPAGGMEGLNTYLFENRKELAGIGKGEVYDTDAVINPDFMDFLQFRHFPEYAEQYAENLRQVTNSYHSIVMSAEMMDNEHLQDYLIEHFTIAKAKGLTPTPRLKRAFYYYNTFIANLLQLDPIEVNDEEGFDWESVEGRMIKMIGEDKGEHLDYKMIFFAYIEIYQHISITGREYDKIKILHAEHDSVFRELCKHKYSHFEWRKSVTETIGDFNKAFKKSDARGFLSLNGFQEVFLHALFDYSPLAEEEKKNEKQRRQDERDFEKGKKIETRGEDPLFPFLADRRLPLEEVALLTRPVVLPGRNEIKKDMQKLLINAPNKRRKAEGLLLLQQQAPRAMHFGSGFKSHYSRK